jgi:hypothetical protein
MAPIDTPPKAARPLNIIERTFEVFSGPEGTMDRTGFVKFCESSKKVPASDADTIFLTVVQNARSGMTLGEFKAALELCVKKEIRGERICAGRKCLKENHNLNITAGLKPKCSSTFRWSPPP